MFGAPSTSLTQQYQEYPRHGKPSPSKQGSAATGQVRDRRCRAILQARSNDRRRRDWDGSVGQTVDHVVVDKTMLGRVERVVQPSELLSGS